MANINKPLCEETIILEVKETDSWSNINESFVESPKYGTMNCNNPDNNNPDNNNPKKTDLQINTNTSDLKMIDLMSPVRINSRTLQHTVINALPVAVAESVTAGALSNNMCSEPGSSQFFLGGVIAYNMKTQKKMLNVDDVYAEKNNFANPFTTYTMARNVTELFNARIGISTTGYSLPTYRGENKDKGLCEINVDIPYAYVCLFDALLDTHKVLKLTNNDYNILGNQKRQRAEMQVKVAVFCKKLYKDYCQSCQMRTQNNL